ncbi:hypothetical protein BSU04_24500 [Caballeronia sordidicola]|uniref:Uncharacterized protein n=1 Tax=Caballeronia sordidicola TaxID=196367 RepID=A0A226WYN9_CABSO|nr:hypothetical protein BSU04_24500 [Caballeronia sordidicola]
MIDFHKTVQVFDTARGCQNGHRRTQVVRAGSLTRNNIALQGDLNVG